jgi:hypothetical protein
VAREGAAQCIRKSAPVSQGPHARALVTGRGQDHDGVVQGGHVLHDPRLV